MLSQALLAFFIGMEGIFVQRVKIYQNVGYGVRKERTILPVKIVHAADFHLESPFSGLSAAMAELRREELKRTFLRVMDLAAKEGAQVLLLAGDLFEHGRAGRELMHFLNQAFSKSQAKIFIAPGNHDPGLTNSPYWSYPWSENVHIFREKFEAVHLPDLDCMVYGLGFAHFAVKDPLLAHFRVADRKMLNLVVLHGEDVSSPVAARSSNYLPFSVSELALAGADYYALGHYHRPRVLWEEGGSIRACYSGSPEPLGYDEEGEHGVFCGLVAKEGNKVSFVRLNSRSYRTVSVACGGEEFLEQLAELAVKRVPEAERQQNFSRLVFSGEVDPGLEFDRVKLEGLLASQFFACRVENATVPAHEWTGYDLRTARGMFASKLQVMLAKETDDEEKEIIRQGLYYGLDALNLGKVVER